MSAKTARRTRQFHAADLEVLQTLVMESAG